MAGFSWWQEFHRLFQKFIERSSLFRKKEPKSIHKNSSFLGQMIMVSSFRNKRGIVKYNWHFELLNVIEDAFFNVEKFSMTFIPQKTLSRDDKIVILTQNLRTHRNGEKWQGADLEMKKENSYENLPLKNQDRICSIKSKDVLSCRF